MVSVEIGTITIDGVLYVKVGTSQHSCCKTRASTIAGSTVH
jgi:hypothetical protein